MNEDDVRYCTSLSFGLIHGVLTYLAANEEPSASTDQGIRVIITHY